MCSGLFDEYDDDLNYYKSLFLDHVHKKMICTNPDLIVDTGDQPIDQSVDKLVQYILKYFQVSLGE